MEFGDRPNSDR